ncbi:MAG: hypothetical protein ABI895_03575 [Deltaproteobacteria bacterium]
MNAPAPSPLDAEQVRVLIQTRALGKKLRLARGIALTNVLSLAFLGFVSVVIDLFSLSLPLVGLALLLLAFNEERGRRQLVALDSRAPNQLAWNQLALFLLVLVYCAHSAYATLHGPDPLAALASQSAEISDTLGQLSQQMDGDLSDLGAWARTVTLLIYGAALLGSAIVQGLTALYYRSLQSSLEMLARAPEWARALD